MLEIIGQVIKFIIALLMNKFESDKAKQKEKEEVLKEIQNGIATNDRSKITSGFSKLKRK